MNQCLFCLLLTVGRYRVAGIWNVDIHYVVIRFLEGEVLGDWARNLKYNNWKSIALKLNAGYFMILSDMQTL